jgi:hypothetical protein
MRWYSSLCSLAFVAVVICLVPAGGGRLLPATGAAVVVLAQAALVTGAAARLSGGQFRPLTPAGHAALARAREQVPPEPDDRMLHRAALHGLRVFPAFDAAARRGDTDASLSPGERNASALVKVFGAAARLFGAGGR